MMTLKINEHVFFYLIELKICLTITPISYVCVHSTTSYLLAVLGCWRLATTCTCNKYLIMTSRPTTSMTFH